MNETLKDAVIRSLMKELPWIQEAYVEHPHLLLERTMVESIRSKYPLIPEETLYQWVNELINTIQL